MQYSYIKYKEGDHALQEVIEHLQFKTKIGMFSIKLCRTPNSNKILSYNPLIVEGEEYRHRIYAYYVRKPGCHICWADNPSFPDTQEGFDAALKLFQSQLDQYHKMKDHSPKRWAMFKSKK
jgi:hypothetical protein